jgi:hypothetical protein
VTDVSPEALAQAREQLVSEGWKPDWIANFAAYAEQRALLNTERATVIELRRQLAETEAACSREIDRCLEQWRTELATERQRASDLEEAWNNARAACLRAEQERDAERQRAEAAERDYAAALKQLDYAAHRIGKGTTELEASEAKRKALREACEGLADEWTMTATAGNCSNLPPQEWRPFQECARELRSLLAKQSSEPAAGGEQSGAARDTAGIQSGIAHPRAGTDS